MAKGIACLNNIDWEEIWGTTSINKGCRIIIREKGDVLERASRLNIEKSIAEDVSASSWWPHPFTLIVKQTAPIINLHPINALISAHQPIS